MLIITALIALTALLMHCSMHARHTGCNMQYLQYHRSILSFEMVNAGHDDAAEPATIAAASMHRRRCFAVQHA